MNEHLIIEFCFLLNGIRIHLEHYRITWGFRGELGDEWMRVDGLANRWKKPEVRFLSQYRVANR